MSLADLQPPFTAQRVWDAFKADGGEWSSRMPAMAFGGAEDRVIFTAELDAIDPDSREWRFRIRSDGGVTVDHVVVPFPPGYGE